jgi:mannose-6-phosphate isomerase-like protein (cupin superfamily)
LTHAIFLPEQLEFVDRGDGSGRTLLGINDALTQTAAKFWRYPPRTRGKRHAEHLQEELIVVLEGTAAIDIGDPPERFELPPGSVCAVQPRVVRQLRNDGDQDVLFFIVGAPPEEGGADYFPDVDEH